MSGISLDALDTAEAKVERQRDRLRAREEQVRRLRAEVTRLHALVADLRATVSPAWDEDAMREDVTVALRRLLPMTQEPALGETATVLAVAVLAVVRDRLPVSGESRAQVQAEALREAAREEYRVSLDCDNHCDDATASRLRARADRIEGENRG